MHRGQQLTLLGGFGLLAGAALPWLTASGPLGTSLSMAGYEGDGIITGGLGLVLVLVGFLSKGKPGKTYSILGVIAAVGSLYILGNVVVNLAAALGETAAEAAIAPSMGPGVYLSLVAAILGVVGGAVKTPSPAQSMGAQSDPALPG